MTETLDFSHFLDGLDGIGHCVVLVLAGMSVAAWYLILSKSWQLWLTFSRSREYLLRFRAAGHLEAAQGFVTEEPPSEPFGRLATAAWDAYRQLGRPKPRGAIQLTAADDYLAAALGQAVALELARLEEGLAVLSSVAATAPFVGLFGTVWGIYHALIAIGASGQASLEQLAGAVGEALIMTGCGLAVAIPAVLGYNALACWNGKILGRLESFGHELFVLMTTGSVATSAVAEIEAAPLAAAE